jgi:hypothetical protein
MSFAAKTAAKDIPFYSSIISVFCDEYMLPTIVICETAATISSM